MPSWEIYCPVKKRAEQSIVWINMFPGSLLSNKVIPNNFLPFPLRDCILCPIGIKLVACFGQWNVNRWSIEHFYPCGILSFLLSLCPKISMSQIGVVHLSRVPEWGRHGIEVEATSEGCVMGARTKSLLL